ncbi:hypothetical protein BaRGS_00003031 [Batillaria attramentaria]|uniref:PRELI/MSF1 domain-containing protein n=1 Tax=Batillaria attramentaria TaxID=370345 RepID=A0ABD0M1G2_9CAEN
MKIWTSEHTFDHPWETVVTAAWRKYPNPHNPAVIGMDVVDRKVDPKGILRSHRLISTAWGLPTWATKLVGMDKVAYASEHSEVDPQNKRFTLRARNVLEYTPHPEDSSKTQLRQEAVVNVYGIPLCSKMESIMTESISKNAGKGRQAMEWVIGKIKVEAQELSTEAMKLSEELSTEARKHFDSVSTEAKKHWDSVLPHVKHTGTTSNSTL